MKKKKRYSTERLKIILPSLFALTAFILSIFLFLIPRSESIAVEQKKKGIEQLVTLTVQIMEHFNALHRSGDSTLKEAQAQAAQTIRELQYGPDMKDYFWIINSEPVMIAHPYRPELEGTYVGDYRDDNDHALFIEMVDLAEEQGEGYARYLWQLRDKEKIIAEKLSFVKLYEPWDWIVGTGIYLRELEEEIAGLTQSMTIVSLCVAVLVGGFLVYVIRQGISIERAKAHVENKLVMSEDKYEFLVEFMKEGILVQNREGLFTFVNDSFGSMLGYRKDELIGRPLIDFIAPSERDFFIKQIEKRRRGSSESYKLNWITKSGELFNSMVSPKPLYTPKGEYNGSFGAVTDITLMQRMLDEKNLLLNEIHHRVKNNLQLISSLLNLQKSESSHSLVRRHLTDTQNRIQTMAMVHDSLYQSERFDNIAFDTFIRQLSLGIRASSVEFCSYNIHMDLPSEPVFIDVAKAIPAGLIVQELLSIPLKGIESAPDEQRSGAADPAARDGSRTLDLELKLQTEDSRIRIVVLYNNDPFCEPEELEKKGGGRYSTPLALELVEVLAEQIGGTIETSQHEGRSKIIVDFGNEKG